MSSYDDYYDDSYVSEAEWEKNRKELSASHEPNGDTYFRMTLEQYQEKFKELGYELVLKDEFTHSHCGRERSDAYYVYAHRDGFILGFDTYTSCNDDGSFSAPSLNSGSVYYNWQPNAGLTHRAKLTSSGGYVRYDKPEEGPDVFVGYHDIREGLRHNTEGLKANGVILNRWIKNNIPWLASQLSITEQDRSVPAGQPARDEWNRWIGEILARSTKNYEALPEWVQQIMGEAPK